MEGLALLKICIDGIAVGNADAVLAASIFHFGTYTVHEVKEYLSKKGVNVRQVYE